MKRLISLFLAVVMLVSMFTVALITTNAETYGDFEYVVLPDMTVEITGSSGYLNNVVIPEMLDGYFVSSIGYGAFGYNNEIETVDIPDSVHRIGDRAFTNCESLEKVSFPDTLEYVGEDAFWGTRWYRDQPQGAVYINDILYDYKGEVPENTTLEVRDGTKSIMDYIFNGDSSWGIVDIVIPDSVEYIGGNTFYGTQWYNNHPDGLVYAGNVLYDYKGKMPADTKVEIKDGTVAIADKAFENYSNLKEVTLPDSLKTIGAEAFYSCTGLTSVTLPDKVESIGAEAFNWCKKLKSVTLSKWLKRIEDSAFSKCTSLEEITIPEFVYSMGHDVFSGCSSLAKVDNKGFMPVIGRNAFSGCKALTSIDIPDTVVIVDNWAFMDCEALAEIKMSHNIDFVGNNAFARTKWLENQPDGLVYINDILYTYKGEMAENTVLNIGEATTDICASAFYMCENLVEVTIPESIECIREFTFAECYDLEKVILPESVKSIEDEAFKSCEKLAEIIIPSSVKLIDSGAFTGCYSLKSLTILSDDCTIFPFSAEESKTIPSSTVIYGFEGSTAQSFAKDNGNEFIVISEPIIDGGFGDTDGDGKVSVMDATAIQFHLAQIKMIPEELTKNGDADKDGTVSVMDATQIQFFLAQLIPEL